MSPLPLRMQSGMVAAGRYGRASAIASMRADHTQDTAMTVIAGSSYTVAAGASGAWFTATGTVFLADVDNDADVTIETRRDGSDTAPKPLHDEVRKGPRVLQGPCCVPVLSVAGRQYRFSGVRGSAVCAADV